MRIIDSSIILATFAALAFVSLLMPMPSVLLDLGMAISFSLAILILSLVLLTPSASEFIAFPQFILISLIFRVYINIASTKLILTAGEYGEKVAGQTLYGFASFVMGEGLHIGIVVFVIFTLLNFLVLSKGSSRMAEVSARFSLDAMPGKQMAIDADLASGAITHEDASQRRDSLSKESSFYGALDGVAKFVKGDAVLGLLLTAINLIIGVGFGVLTYGMAMGESLKLYAFLTIGDGFVSQIPSLIISFATGLLLAKGPDRKPTSNAIAHQIRSRKEVLLAVSMVCAALALVPGLPTIPFLLVSGSAAAMWFYASQDIEPELEPVNELAAEIHVDKIEDLLEADDILIKVSGTISRSLLRADSGIEQRIRPLRMHIAEKFGLLIPQVRIAEDSVLRDNIYEIHLHGAKVAWGELQGNDVLVLLDQADGHEGTRDPVYGAPAKWYPSLEKEELALSGFTVLTGEEVLLTHLMDVVTNNLDTLMTAKTLKQTLNSLVRQSDPVKAEGIKLCLSDAIPDKISNEYLLDILKGLLSEGISIRGFSTILDAAVEAKSNGFRGENAVEFVRQRINRQVLDAAFDGAHDTQAITLDPRWEDLFSQSEVGAASQPSFVAIQPEELKRLSARLFEAASRSTRSGLSVALVVSAKRRRYLRSVLDASQIKLPVVSFEELGSGANIKFKDVIPFDA
ncbi:flagellar biosynthesis protein FlhA [Donghicola sp. C2-DW-16]|uniref:Flagellar biosynthesis protein FlhA n=1 Tax=Donghicola mangrovi TaxID=2729614 RepID=A0ABX2P944_9RHOB|nr:FHIPEP family type III secretion protein [Donghicola mangrovi]NVO25974.1 flagellar biosynthesis protein FlhA [Donghicola mangrovi]